MNHYHLFSLSLEGISLDSGQLKTPLQVVKLAAPYGAVVGLGKAKVSAAACAYQENLLHSHALIHPLNRAISPNVA